MTNQRKVYIYILINCASFIGRDSDKIKICLWCCVDYAGFNLANYKDANSATSLYGRIYMPLVSTVMTMAFIATFGV